MSVVCSDGGIEDSIIEEFRKTSEPFLTAAEIAEKIGEPRQKVNYRLKQLEERDVVDRKRAGSRAVGWWIVD